jgi:outer membrane assembly lipoprotein YfiO
MTRWALPLVLTLAAMACGGRNSDSNTLAPMRSASPAAVDSLWRRAEFAVRHAKWNDAIKELERLLLELGPDDPRTAKARYYLGEAHMGKGDRLEAAREFRKAIDDSPDAPIAPDALLRVGDAYAELWRRPELDPAHGQSALEAYQELLSRYPNSPAAARAQLRITELNDRFAYKAYRAGRYYFRLKAYDSAILYLQDLVATYPRATVTPDALVLLIQAYGKLGYSEDIKEKCEYARRYHPDEPALTAACPAAVPDTAVAAVPDTAAAP